MGDSPKTPGAELQAAAVAAVVQDSGYETNRKQAWERVSAAVEPLRLALAEEKKAFEEHRFGEKERDALKAAHATLEAAYANYAKEYGTSITPPGILGELPNTHGGRARRKTRRMKNRAYGMKRTRKGKVPKRVPLTKKRKHARV